MIHDPRYVTFAGDWHHDPNAAIFGLDEARRRGADVVVQLGDVVFTGPAFTRMAHAMEVAAQRAGIPIVIIRGNHDDRGRLDALPASDEPGLLRVAEQVYYAPNGTVLRWRGRALGVMGGAASVDHRGLSHGVDWWDDELPTLGDIHRLAERARDLDILIAHDAPRTQKLEARLRRGAIPSGWDLAYAEQSSDLVSRAMWALRPKLLVAGHLHLRWSESVVRMNEATRLEVLDKGDGYSNMIPDANLLDIDLESNLLH
ncbi:hypothetical protein GCM10025867_48050 (plasmid) [Frondihabitans sucicola]|uniref:Calcineurin-like phosphoesterase domain-containing protein n=1 Tax=Frondihabitans sucicola TaxID=1268041 RepID=A0ABN6Y5J4_9MICO|nr:metallophosphoesterase [Frondihabitans sucicola]BDZ52564.1 hypothetical protein GCM10025867_48050 [Frondihabitans sucicola]